jgi:hypothetical protein
MTGAKPEIMKTGIRRHGGYITGAAPAGQFTAGHYFPKII